MKKHRCMYRAMAVLLMINLIAMGNVFSQKTKNKFVDEAPAAFVSPKNVPLEHFALEEIPIEWELKGCGELKAVEEYRRAGFKGIQWNWNNGDVLDIEVSDQLNKYLRKEYHKVAFGGGIGFQLWIYNPKALKNDNLTLALAANGYQKEIKFGLNYSGWRACYIQFAEMPKGGNASEGHIQITAPESLDEGWVVFDRFEIGRLPSHSMADHQLPYSKNDNHWVNQYWWETGQKELVNDVNGFSSSMYEKMIENIKSKKLGWNLYVDEILSAEQQEIIITGEESERAWVLTNQLREDVEKKYESLGIKRVGDKIVGQNIAVPFGHAPAYENEISWRDVEDRLLPMIIFDYIAKKDQASKDRVLNVLDWFEQQGVVAGHSYGSTSHIGYRSRNLAVSLLFARDLLEETGRLDRWISTLKWLTGFAECYHKKERPGGVGDDGTVSLSRLICVLMQDNSADKDQDMACFMRWFNDVLTVSDGTQGVIKPDYCFYHHALMLIGYWQTNITQFNDLLMVFTDTPFASSISWKNVRQNLMVFNRIYRGADLPFNLLGRGRSDGKKKLDFRVQQAALELALNGNPKTGDAVDKELAAIWLRNRMGDAPIPDAFKGIKPSMRYHQVLNWAGVSTHSIPDATVMITGVNNNLMNWDAGVARVYSRYNRTGSMYIHAKPQGEFFTTADCGYVDEGWDWSRIPGVTGIYLSNDKLKAATKKSAGYGDERSFAGGASLLNNGVYGYRISETADQGWNGNKSWFFFEDRIVCLGSDLTCGAGETLETTMFQLALPKKSSAFAVDGKKIAEFPYNNAVQGKELKLVDNQGHGYYIPASNDAVELRKQSQTNGDRCGKVHSGDFALAWFNHGVSPKAAKYEYMIQLNAPVAKANYTVLQQDETAHVVKDNVTGMVGYVVFKPAKNLPGPISECSVPGLMMVKPSKDALKIGFCDPDIKTNPGGKITRYNLGDALASPVRNVKLTLSKQWKYKNSATNVVEFKTSNAVEEHFELKK
ncbi:hypothetical protein EYV94_07650 [Puteibacter caeruleilacunae]|nr:hypothetical protein EYV94_07650 [Puteibacter caeruleilacunae]